MRITRAWRGGSAGGDWTAYNRLPWPGLGLSVFLPHCRLERSL